MQGIVGSVKFLNYSGWFSVSWSLLGAENFFACGNLVGLIAES